MENKKNLQKDQLWQSLATASSPEVATALREAHDFYDGHRLVEWLANLYEPEIGGFYYSNSARDNEPYRPDIESTAFALSLLTANGAIKDRNEDLPVDIQKKIVGFAKGLQCETDGYFYHPQWPQGRENLAIDRYGRDIGNACGVITGFRLDEDGSGVKRQQHPNFCAPGASKCKLHFGTNEQCVFPTVLKKVEKKSDAPANKSNHPDYSSLEAFLCWVDEFNGGDEVKNNSGNAHLIESIRFEIHKYGYREALLDYLDRVQGEIFDEQIAQGITPSGVFQRCADYRAVWAFYKYTSIYDLNKDTSRKINIKYVPYIVDTFIKVIAMPPDGSYRINDVMNQWIGVQRLINNVLKHYGEDEVEKIYERMRESAATLVHNTVEKLRAFKISDGSFAFNHDGTTLARIYSVPVSLGLAEGDVNSTLLALNTYRTMFSCLGYTPVPLFDEEDGERFVEIITNIKPPIKKSND